MRVREAVPEDAPAIAEVHIATWRTSYVGLVPQPYLDGLQLSAAQCQWNARLQDGGLTLVAEDEAGIFGFASGGRCIHPVDGFDGEVGAVYLRASHQRRGVGAELMRRMASGLLLRGFGNLVVWALRQNPACGFYERLGGVRVAEQMIEIGGVELPEVAFGWREIRDLLSKPSRARVAG